MWEGAHCRPECDRYVHISGIANSRARQLELIYSSVMGRCLSGKRINIPSRLAIVPEIDRCV